MTKREEFKLEFLKIKSPADGQIDFACQSTEDYNPYGCFFFLNLLDVFEADHFIDEITLIQNNLPYDPDFIFTDATEIIAIEFNNPYFLLENHLEIHMDDFKALIQEWKNFITMASPPTLRQRVSKWFKRL
ncbi:hypothetical protein [Mucilaginibacter sp. CSA2-8R]|uniref:hypothetical protein n=1 Tax=Mucilaginibacter sp. CSA2-8R TaxID=3141542 RepID=UPI00315DB5E3